MSRGRAISAPKLQALMDCQANISTLQSNPPYIFCFTLLHSSPLTKIHAHRYKLFNLSKAYNKGLSQSDVQLMATSVLLAALSILPYEHRDKDRTEADSELEKERSVRMATILGFSVNTKQNAR